MKLLVNISSLGARPTGLGVYGMHCAQALSNAFDVDVVAADGVEDFDNVVLRAPASHALGAGRTAALRRWAWSKQHSFPERLVYSPTHHALGRSRGQILTVHDLIALRYPQQHPAQAWFFRYGLPAELATARAVFTVSETSRQDIHATYRYPLDRIKVVPNGVDRTVFHPASANSAPSQPSEPFLLVVGASFTHKNVTEILDNAALWRDRYRLVIASCRGAYRRALQRAVQAAPEQLRERVQFVDYVALPELVSLYQSCAALISASRWEGFGVPPLEALACGARVIVSDIPAHREVLGTHAEYVRLGDRESWAHALASLDEPARPCAARLPLLRAYAWERSGERLVDHLLTLEPRLARRIPQPLTAARRITQSPS
jgi:glycosyltransferase involved in cell wall biosynthesis